MHQLLLALAVSTPGLVENETPTAEAVARDAAAPLTFSVTPGAWMVRLRGESSWGSSERTYNDQLHGRHGALVPGRVPGRTRRLGHLGDGHDLQRLRVGQLRGQQDLGRFNFAAGERALHRLSSVAIEGQWNPVDLIGEPNADIPLFLTASADIWAVSTPT